MSNNLKYLRVTKNWSRITDKQDIPIYVANVSKDPVEFFLYGTNLSDISPTAVKAKTYVTGGSIGQVTVHNIYMYARSLAESEDSITTVAIDTKPIGESDIEEQTLQIDKLLSEVITLTQRLNVTQERICKNDVLYYGLIRYMVDRDNSTGILINGLSTRVVNLYSKLFAVENFIAKFRTEIFLSKNKIQAIEQKLSMISPENITSQINYALLSIKKIEELLEVIAPSLDNAEGIITGALEPVKEQIAAINNSIATLSLTRTKEEIYEARDELLKLYRDEDYNIETLISNFAELVVEMENKLDVSNTSNDVLVLNTKSLTDIDVITKQ